MARPGVLLVNLGTPDAPDRGSVRAYLRQFLSDPRVVDLSPIVRWLLVHLVIAPFRSGRSAEAYRAIWTEQGSPLLVHGRALAAGVSERLPDVPVELGMRYGSPALPAALERLEAAGCDRLIVLPLYPQFAASSTGSTLEAVYRAAAARWNPPHVAVVPPFYDDPGFLDACARVGREALDGFEPDRVLFSFHGLPERQVRRSDPSGGHCLSRPDCCDDPGPSLSRCYRAQCFRTARSLAARLELAGESWTVAFQSRLGRTPWIRPFTDEVLPRWARQGVRRVAVFSPSFVADCLETLEEIGLRARRDFRAAGGEELMLVPSLNAHRSWIDAVETLVRRLL